jgi:hypothetical protein
MSAGPEIRLCGSTLMRTSCLSIVTLFFLNGLVNGCLSGTLWESLAKGVHTGRMSCHKRCPSTLAGVILLALVIRHRVAFVLQLFMYFNCLPVGRALALVVLSRPL